MPYQRVELVGASAITIIPPAGINDGNAVVAFAGTRVQLSVASVPCASVLVIALATNTGNIFVGGVLVAAGRGAILTPGESVPIDIDDLNKVYIDAAVGGEGVTYVYVA